MLSLSLDTLKCQHISRSNGNNSSHAFRDIARSLRGEVSYRGETTFGNEKVDGGRDRGGGSGEGLRVVVEEVDVDTVHGDDLGYSGAHLATTHHSNRLDFPHLPGLAELCNHRLE